MKHHFIFIFAIAVGLFFVAGHIAEAVVPLNFGTTKVISTFTPGIVCPGYGPITIAPNGLWPATPYFLSLPVAATKLAQPYPGVQMLGKYYPVPTPQYCITTTFPPAPVTVPMFNILFYNSSLAPRPF